MIKVLVADDNASVRAALKRIIEKTTDITVGGEAASGLEAICMIGEQMWDVVLLDVSMPDFGGLEVLRRIMGERPDLRVLMVSVHSEEVYAARALRAGASGYLTKENAAERLATAIRQLSRGATYFSPSITERLRFEKEGALAESQTNGTLRKIDSDS